MKPSCIGGLGAVFLLPVLSVVAQTPSTDGRDAPTPADTESVRHFRVQSARLTAFWGRPIFIEAGVVLPPERTAGEVLPVCYRVNGFSGSHRSAWMYGPHLVRRMSTGDYPRMLYVFLNAACPQGHHVFADSVSNGPWAAALVKELIPALESEYGAAGRPEARFLTGHSSGGWSSAWLQVTYPDFFNGVWSTAPDPVDFRSFFGVDIYSASNMYRDKNGKESHILRSGGEWIMTLRDAVAQEDRGRYHGGQFGSFDYTFSPRRDDGRPMRLYNHETGAIDSDVAQAWKRYDISMILRENWAALGPKLKGKLHFYCGKLDDFGLEAAVLLLQDELTALGSDAVFILVEGRDHRSLYDSHPVHWPHRAGMLEHIHREMRERWEESERIGRAKRDSTVRPEPGSTDKS